MYRVMVDDHAHYQDEEHRHEHGVFATAEQAIAACRAIVDGELRHLHKPGMIAKDLFEMYGMFGEDPFILPCEAGVPSVDFSAWDYAKQQSMVLTAARDEP